MDIGGIYQKDILGNSRMDRGNSAEIAVDDLNWQARSDYWRTYQPVSRGAPKKFKYREPLILCGHGVRVRMDHNTLLIRNGFTHYPQKVEEIRFFPGDANLPDQIIILDGSGGISFHALKWMSDQKINLVQLNWRGEAINCSGRIGFSAHPKVVAAQRVAKTGICGTQIARWLIAGKIEASISTLRNAIPNSESRNNAIIRHQKRLSEIRSPRNSISISQLLGIEGDCAQSYFKAWHGQPIKWSKTKRNPIPTSWLEIAPRTMVWKKRAYVARHPLNAMLNYGYGILINSVRTQVNAAGLDPTIGIIHGNKNPEPLVYDLMEPLRPVVDKAVIEFALGHTFTTGDFTISNFGGCRLNPQMAKALATIVCDLDCRDLVASFLKRI